MFYIPIGICFQVHMPAITAWVNHDKNTSSGPSKMSVRGYLQLTSCYHDSQQHVLAV
jgi:hypothetical protein